MTFIMRHYILGKSTIRSLAEFLLSDSNVLDQVQPVHTCTHNFCDCMFNLKIISYFVKINKISLELLFKANFQNLLFEVSWNQFGLTNSVNSVNTLIFKHGCSNHFNPLSLGDKIACEWLWPKYTRSLLTKQAFRLVFCWQWKKLKRLDTNHMYIKKSGNTCANVKRTRP